MKFLTNCDYQYDDCEDHGIVLIANSRFQLITSKPSFTYSAKLGV